MELKVNIDSVEIELQEYNVNELKEWINKLRSQESRTKSLCDRLDEELIKQKGISLPTVIQLSTWCNTNVPYTKAESIANEISKLLFNMKLPRLD